LHDQGSWDARPNGLRCRGGRGVAPRMNIAQRFVTSSRPGAARAVFEQSRAPLWIGPSWELVCTGGKGFLRQAATGETTRPWQLAVCAGLSVESARAAQPQREGDVRRRDPTALDVISREEVDLGRGREQAVQQAERSLRLPAACALRNQAIQGSRGHGERLRCPSVSRARACSPASCSVEQLL